MNSELIGLLYHLCTEFGPNYWHSQIAAVRAHAPTRSILEHKRKCMCMHFGKMDVQISDINETLKVPLGFSVSITQVNNQESLKRVIKRGEIVAFVGSDPDCRIWIGSVNSEVDVTSERISVTWLKYRRTSKGIVYLTQDTGEDDIHKSSCLGSVDAFNRHCVLDTRHRRR